MNSHWTALNTTEFSYQIWSCPIFLPQPKRADWLMWFRLWRWIFMSLFWLVCRNLMGSCESVLWWCTLDHYKHVLTALARCSQYKISHVHDVLRDYIIAEVGGLWPRQSWGAFSSFGPFPVWYIFSSQVEVHHINQLQAFRVAGFSLHMILRRRILCLFIQWKKIVRLPSEFLCLMSLWNYDTENHTENFCDTEKIRKPHWKTFTKEIAVIIQDYLTEIFSFVVQGHWNHTEKF